MKKRVVSLIAIFIYFILYLFILSLISHFVISQEEEEAAIVKETVTREELTPPQSPKTTEESTKKVTLFENKQFNKNYYPNFKDTKIEGEFEIKRTRDKSLEITREAPKKFLEKGKKATIKIKEDLTEGIKNLNLEKTSEGEFLIIEFTPGEFQATEKLKGKILKLPITIGEDINIDSKGKKVIVTWSPNSKKYIKARTKDGKFVKTKDEEFVVSQELALNEESLKKISKSAIGEEKTFLDLSKINLKHTSSTRSLDIIIDDDSTITLLNKNKLSKKEKEFIDRTIEGFKGKVTISSYRDYNDRGKAKIKILETGKDAKVETIAGVFSLTPISNNKGERNLNDIKTGNVRKEYTIPDIIRPTLDTPIIFLNDLETNERKVGYGNLNTGSFIREGGTLVQFIATKFDEEGKPTKWEKVTLSGTKITREDFTDINLYRSNIENLQEEEISEEKTEEIKDKYTENLDKKETPASENSVRRIFGFPATYGRGELKQFNDGRYGMEFEKDKREVIEALRNDFNINEIQKETIKFIQHEEEGNVKWKVRFTNKNDNNIVEEDIKNVDDYRDLKYYITD